jgi:hypothetical protein
LEGRGWYLYGIIRQPRDGAASAASIWHETDEVQLLAHAGLAALVRSVPLADFEPAALRARLHDAAWLEIMARHHHEVIASMHQRQAILPAKFGCVYPDEQGLRAALAGSSATLLGQLEQVAECDEWTVHLYAERTTIECRLVESHPALGRTQREIAGASSGRAYLLKRKLARELDAVVEQATRELAQAAVDRLNRYARASSEQPAAVTAGTSHGERELVRAIVLVPRAECDAFRAAVASIGARGDGLRGETSGPWPPYSFATLDEE